MTLSRLPFPGVEYRNRFIQLFSRLQHKLLTITLQGILLSLLVSITVPLLHAAAVEMAAAPPAADEIHTFNVPAGPLDAALDHFAHTAGVNLYYDAALLDGRQSKGLSGNYSIASALSRLLAGSGIEAAPQPGGGYSLHQRTTESGKVTLPSLQVTSTPLGSITEGTGSYTTGATNSSTGLELTLRETPQSITIMTHDRMRDQALTNLDQVLEQVVGIEPDRRSAIGGDTVGYYARGFAVQNYQVDGVIRPGGLYGFFEDTVDMIAYDRIAVVRGPSGLMTGTGTPSATINIIRKKPTETFQANVLAKTGSWDLYRMEADVAGPLIESGRIRGRLAAATQVNDTFVDREHIKRNAIYGIVEADVTDATRLSAGIEYQKFDNKGASRGGVPLFYTDGSETDLSRSTNSGTNWSNFGRDSLNAFVSLEHFFTDDWRVKVDVEHKNASYDQKFGYAYAGAIDRNTGGGASTYITRFTGDVKMDAVNASLLGAFELFNRKQELALTVFHASYRSKAPDYPIWHSGSPYREPINNVYDFYASGTWPQPNLSSTGTTNGNHVDTTAISGVLRIKPVDRVSLILGTRITNWDHTRWSKNGDNPKTKSRATKETGVITPYGGLVVDLTDHWSAYASYTNVFEPQSVKNLSGDFLKPLEGNNYELGVKAAYLNGRLNVSAAIFQMHQRNYPVQEGFQVFAPDGSRAYRGEKVKANGYELEIGGQLLPGWQVAGGFTHAKLEGTERAPLSLTRIPENTFKLFSSYQLSGILRGLTVGGNLKWQDSVHLDGIGPNREDFKQKSIFLVDAMVRYALRDNITISLNLNNIFDKTYYDGIGNGISRYGIPRNFQLSLRYEL